MTKKSFLINRHIWICAALSLIALQLQAQQITGRGHATLTITDNKVTHIDWNTPEGTAARQQTCTRGNFYDKGSIFLFDIWWFSYKYPSTGGDGQPVTLTALACMPDDDSPSTAINNVVIGCHSTITENTKCPTQFNEHGQMHSEVFALMIHAGTVLFGTPPQSDNNHYNLVIIPDYEGYGGTKDRAHPYLCEEITARQVTDAARYGITLYQTDTETSNIRRNFRSEWRTICMGYSQGAAVAMATQRYIEEQDLTGELHLAGSICGDGPYNPIATFLYYMEQDLKDKELEMPVVIPLILKGLCDYNSHLKNYKVSDILEERFLETGILDWIAAKEKSTTDITNQWQLCYIDGKNGDSNYFRNVVTAYGKAMLRNIMKPEVYNYFKQLLTDNPNYATEQVALPAGGNIAEDLHLALEDNNVTRGWMPQHLICLYHSTADDVVPMQNCTSAQTAFGEKTEFYASAANGNHPDTGTEFYTSTAREDCLRKLANQAIFPPTKLEKDAFYNSKDPDAARCYDLKGQPVNKGAHRGIYIKNGKKFR